MPSSGANSGLKLHPDCVSTFNEFKNSTKPTHDFLTMKLGKTDIELDLCPPIGTSDEAIKYRNSEHLAYDHMVEHLLEQGFGYAFYIFQLDTLNSSSKRIAFFTYVGDTCPAKIKMIMTSSKAALEKGCPGFSIKINAISSDDLSYESCMKAAFAR